MTLKRICFIPIVHLELLMFTDHLLTTCLHYSAIDEKLQKVGLSFSIILLQARHKELQPMTRECSAKDVLKHPVLCLTF